MVEPEYYCKNGFSPIQAFEKGLISNEELIGFCKGNVIKYTVRAGSKDDALLDIVKAMDYLTYLHKALTLKESESKMKKEDNIRDNDGDDKDYYSLLLKYLNSFKDK